MHGRVYFNEIDPFAAAWLAELMRDGLIPEGVIDTRSIVDVRASDLRGFDQLHFFAGIGGWAYALELAGWGGDQSGPDHVRVSRFRARDNTKAMPTHDTSGPLFTTSSPSADLQRYLENRLRANLDVNGSPVFVLTWKTQDMPSGPPICALLASARHTPDSGIIGWPTPVVRGGGNFCRLIPYRNHYVRPSGQKAHFGFDQAVRLHAAGTNERGYVNPGFLCWVMGYPSTWMVLVTPSSRRSPRNSSKQPCEAVA